MRQAAKADLNQLSIVSALRKAGCSVYAVGQPLDLLVGRGGVNYILEVKNPDGRDRIEPDQQAFIDTWNGQVAVVRSIDEALAAVGLAKRPVLLAKSMQSA